MKPSTSLLLDTLRFISAQMVVIGHTLGWAFPGAGFEMLGRSGMAAQAVGVVFFFALSGFVIAYTTAAKPDAEKTFGWFMSERFGRIYSGLVPSLLLIAILDLVLSLIAPAAFEHYASFSNVTTFLANLLNLEDYPSLFGLYLSPITATTFGTGIPLWSLAVEWWIYVFFGAIFLPWPKAILARGAVAILTVLSVPVVVENLTGGRGVGLSVIWFSGAIAALAMHRITTTFRSPAAIWFAVSAAVLLLADKITIPIPSGYDLRLNSLLLLALVTAVIGTESLDAKVPRRVAKLSRWMAGYSFTLYLTHYSIVVLLWRGFGLSRWTLLISGLLFSNLVAAPLAQFTERHYKALAALVRQLCRPSLQANPKDAAVLAVAGIVEEDFSGRRRDVIAGDPDIGDGVRNDAH